MVFMRFQSKSVFWLRQASRHLMRVLTLLMAVIATIWLVRGFEARNMPELAIWHTYSLKNEFHARDYPNGITFPQYQQLEVRLDA